MGIIRAALIIALALLFFSSSAQDQPKLVQDSTAFAQDTVLIESFAKRYNPRKALFFSAVLPGMGQVYNKKYWKVPLVYGGFIGGIWMINFQQQRYLKYKGELFDLLNEGVTSVTTTLPNGTTTTTPVLSPSNFTQDQLRTIVNKSRRERDYYSILTGLWYILQMVDAHVDAHLKEFELNPQLHVKIEPMVESDQLVGRNSGVSLKLKFR